MNPGGGSRSLLGTCGELGAGGERQPGRGATNYYYFRGPSGKLLGNSLGASREPSRSLLGGGRPIIITFGSLLGAFNRGGAANYYYSRGPSGKLPGAFWEASGGLLGTLEDLFPLVRSLLGTVWGTGSSEERQPGGGATNYYYFTGLSGKPLGNSLGASWEPSGSFLGGGGGDQLLLPLGAFWEPSRGGGRPIIITFGGLLGSRDGGVQEPSGNLLGNWELGGERPPGGGDQLLLL